MEEQNRETVPAENAEVKKTASAKEALQQLREDGFEPVKQTIRRIYSITEDAATAKKFLDEVDAAAVYHNASTRFTDGGEFGLGAEIGISTQKLHVRGPMGLSALTTDKYIIEGKGQIRC